jgi:beta-xylosidase
MPSFRTLLLTLTVTLLIPITRADVGNVGAWGDQGDGTYKNPILPGDFSNPGVVRVGEDYYMVVSAMQYSPGMAVLHSKDLVNWRFIGHCLPDLTALGPQMNWDKMDAYGKGVFAGTLAYHDGKFWMFTTTMENGVFMTTATHPAGPWTPVHKVADLKHRDDPAPLWDDDGQAYLLLSTPGREKWFTHIYKMAPDGRSIDVESGRVLDDFHTSEGNKFYKINGTYFIFHNECQGHIGNRVGVMLRSKNINGPWEKRTILRGHGPQLDREPNQGDLIQTPDGQWVFITHQGRRGFREGRPVSLLPVQWIDGWPIPGNPDEDGVGTMVWHAKKPINGFPIVTPQTDDDFSDAKLGPQWEWNHQPRDEKWSLTERPGFVRLHAFKPLKRDNLLKAGNTLTQRLISPGPGEVTLKLDLTRMADGQSAGLSHHGKRYAWLGVTQTGGVRHLVYHTDTGRTAGPALASTDLWLRSNLSANGTATWAYSLDGVAFTPFGGDYTLNMDGGRGSRIGVFTYNDQAEAGSIDLDWFRYEHDGPRAK